jgi:hypothetical protein
VGLVVIGGATSKTRRCQQSALLIGANISRCRVGSASKLVDGQVVSHCRVTPIRSALSGGAYTPRTRDMCHELVAHNKFDVPLPVIGVGVYAFSLRLRRRSERNQRPALSRLRKPDVGLASTGAPASPITTRCESTRAIKALMPRNPAATRSSTTEANSVRYTAVK